MEKKPIALEDLIPETPVFTLNGRQFSVRPPNMLDQVWIKRVWGEKFKDILPEENWGEVARFVYHQLSAEDQMYFRARPALIVDELTGDQAEKFLTAAEVLLESISTQAEMLGILGAVYRAIAISNPMVEEVTKKKLAESLAEMNNPALRLSRIEEPMHLKNKSPIGPVSSTPSRTNTGGRKKKSRR